MLGPHRCLRDARRREEQADERVTSFEIGKGMPQCSNSGRNLAERRRQRRTRGRGQEPVTFHNSKVFELGLAFRIR